MGGRAWYAFTTDVVACQLHGYNYYFETRQSSEISGASGDM